MAGLESKADEYMRGHSSGNSYIDDKVRLAYLTGARQAVGDLRDWLSGQLTPFYQQLMERHVDKMLK